MSIPDLLKKYGPKALKALLGVGSAALAVFSLILNKSEIDEDIDEDEDEDDDYETNPYRRTTGHPILPIDLFDEIFLKDGEGEANRILDKVQRGQLDVEDVRKALHRPSIPPEKWRDFEDGWRPDGWD